MGSNAGQDKMAKFLTLCKDTLNILLDGCYLIFEEYLQGKPSAYILKMCLEERLRGGKLLRT